MMALILCAECGKQISDKAVSCPGCGHPVNQLKTNKCIECNHVLELCDKKCSNCGFPLDSNELHKEHNDVNNKINIAKSESKRLELYFCELIDGYQANDYISKIESMYIGSNVKNTNIIADLNAMLNNIQNEINKANDVKHIIDNTKTMLAKGNHITNVAFSWGLGLIIFVPIVIICQIIGLGLALFDNVASGLTLFIGSTFFGVPIYLIYSSNKERSYTSNNADEAKKYLHTELERQSISKVHKERLFKQVFNHW